MDIKQLYIENCEGFDEYTPDGSCRKGLRMTIDGFKNALTKVSQLEPPVKPATCGLDLIIQEKKEKQDKKWGLEHDYKMHPNKELLKAALFCITNEEKYKQGWQFEEKLKIGFADGKLSIVEWEIRRFKKAGAFIASQIDILLEEKNRSKLSV